MPTTGSASPSAASRARCSGRSGRALSRRPSPRASALPARHWRRDHQLPASRCAREVGRRRPDRHGARVPRREAQACDARLPVAWRPCGSSVVSSGVLSRRPALRPRWKRPRGCRLCRLASCPRRRGLRPPWLAPSRLSAVSSRVVSASTWAASPVGSRPRGRRLSRVRAVSTVKPTAAAASGSAATRSSPPDRHRAECRCGPPRPGPVRCGIARRPRRSRLRHRRVALRRARPPQGGPVLPLHPLGRPPRLPWANLLCFSSPRPRDFTRTSYYFLSPRFSTCPGKAPP